MLAVDQLTEQERATLRCALELCLHHWQDYLALLLDGDIFNPPAEFKIHFETGKVLLAELNANNIPEF